MIDWDDEIQTERRDLTVNWLFGSVPNGWLVVPHPADRHLAIEHQYKRARRLCSMDEFVGMEMSVKTDRRKDTHYILSTQLTPSILAEMPELKAEFDRMVQEAAAEAIAERDQWHRLALDAYLRLPLADI